MYHIMIFHVIAAVSMSMPVRPSVCIYNVHIFIVFAFKIKFSRFIPISKTLVKINVFEKCQGAKVRTHREI